MKTVIGIDPGKNGGIAFIDTEKADERDGVESYKMPETEKDLWTLLNGYDLNRCIAFIEKVHSSPQMGVTSAFTFGRGYGTLLGLLTASYVPFEEISPQKWQKALGCMTKGDKNVSKRKAQQLFPWLKITHANADALLIAKYGVSLEGSA